MANSPKRYLSAYRESHFPNLNRSQYEVTSEETPALNCLLVPPYNCIAFAAGDDQKWWWPDPDEVYFWPPGVSRKETVEGFVEMFESLGYEECDSADHEPGFEKVSIYRTRYGSPDALPGSPTHAALQKDNGVWKSKLGHWEDIEHVTLECLGGEDVTGTITPYGEPIRFLKRPSQANR